MTQSIYQIREGTAYLSVQSIGSFALLHVLLPELDGLPQLEENAFGLIHSPLIVHRYYYY